MMALCIPPTIEETKHIGHSTPATPLAPVSELLPPLSGSSDGNILGSRQINSAITIISAHTNFGRLGLFFKMRNL